MSNDPMPLRSDADAAARRAFRAASQLYDMADWHGINPRTIDRIAQGKRVVPPGLARAAAAMVQAVNVDNEREIKAHAQALLAWADHCAIERALVPATGVKIGRENADG